MTKARMMRRRGLFLVSAFCVVCFVTFVNAKKSKYSADVNTADRFDDTKDYQTMENPFRMQKVNLLWHKAQRRLPENKLKLLFADLKSQDKEEIMLKKIKSEGQDKAGVKENSLRKQLNAIIKKYALSDPWLEPDTNETAKDVVSDPGSDYLNKQLFKDKKLNKLWLKAEQTGFNDEEMKVLKEELQHHQDKIDQYYMLMDRVNDPLSDKKDEAANSIDAFLDAERQDKSSAANHHQLLKEKHRNIKDDYKRLLDRVAGDKGEFEEYAVQSLWELAQKADFSPSELNSLKDELHHYENRIRKLRFFQSELDLHNEGHFKSKDLTDKPDEQKHLHKKVKDFEYKVSKLHNELEGRIMQRHSEL